MIELAVLKQDGSKADTVSISEDAFGGKVRSRLLHDVVIMYGANKRVGTAKTKTRSEAAGATGKLYRQKGTGRARAGSSRTPVRTGGGRAHGPTPRDYSKHINRKMKKAALDSALLSKLRDDEVVVFEALELAEPKTKLAAKVLADAGVGERCLVVVPEPDEALWRAMRNIKFVRMAVVKDLNAYDVVRAHKLVLTRASLDHLLGGGA